MKLEVEMTEKERLTVLKVKEQWKHLMTKCYNSFEDCYRSWGGVGMTVHRDWHIFERYYDDVGLLKEDEWVEPVNWKRPIGPDNFKVQTLVKELPKPEPKWQRERPKFDPRMLRKPREGDVRGGERKAALTVHHNGRRLTLYDVCMLVEQSPATVNRKMIAFHNRTELSEVALDVFLREVYGRDVPVPPPERSP